MAFKKQSNSNTNSKAKTHKEVNDNASIITCGFGFVNYLTEREGRNGPYTTCQIRLATGSKELGTREYREFDVLVTGKKAEEILWDYADELADEETNVYFKLCLSDIKPKYYERDGEIIAGVDSYLIAIEKMWVDGDVVYERQPQSNDSNNDDDEEEQKPRKGKSNSRSNSRQSQNSKASSSRGSANKGASRSSDSGRSSGSSRRRNAA